MINKTILLLVYYYKHEDHEHGLLKHVINKYCPAYLPFDLYLYQPLQKVFSRVILYDYLKRGAEIGIGHMNKEIVRLMRQEHAEYVLWTSFYYDIQPSTLRSIRKGGSTVVGWFFDDDWRFEDYSKWWIPYLDYCVTNAVTAIPKYQELGARVVQTIPNTGIAVDRDWSSIKEKYEVSFVGTRTYTDREKWIDELMNNNVQLQVFGEGSGGYVSFEEMLNIFSNTKINLNFSSAGPNSQVRQIKGRVFQVCMAGGFMLTEYAPGIEKYFELDKEIVCFQDKRELMDKITYYLNHDQERRAIARAGWKRATSEYTSSHMVSEVFHGIEKALPAKRKEVKVSRAISKMPKEVRKRFADYYIERGRTFLRYDYKALWQDAYALSLRYYPLNRQDYYQYILSRLPYPVRIVLVRLYHVVRKFRGAG